MRRPECIWPARAFLGESPSYDPRDNSLLFVDIKRHRLYRLDLGNDDRRHWQFDEEICWVAPRASSTGFIAGMRSSFAELALDPCSVRPFATPEQPEGNRFNDAKVDPFGRIWAGSMDDSALESTGSLYSISDDLKVRKMDSGYCIANGPTFSPAGDFLYHTDTARRTVWRFGLSPEGELFNKRVFVVFEDDWGNPDGMTTDEEGGVWIAHWGGSCVSRFSPDGKRSEVVPVGARFVTSCAFAGPQRDRLFITSATDGVDDQATAGGLFEHRPSTRGLAPVLFAG